MATCYGGPGALGTRVLLRALVYQQHTRAHQLRRGFQLILHLPAYRLPRPRRRAHKVLEVHRFDVDVLMEVASTGASTLEAGHRGGCEAISAAPMNLNGVSHMARIARIGLIGFTGVGKSTIAQHLKRAHGFR